MFNTIGKDFTIFIKQNNKEGLHNIFIHDTRDAQRPTTLIAKKGNIINTDFSTKIFLRDGSQQFQSQNKKLSILYFDEYLLNIIQGKDNSIFSRWKSPAERTMHELLNPDKNSLDDIKNSQAFKAEVTARFAMPLNVLFFSILILSFILTQKFDRLENVSRTIKILSLIVFLQVLSILSSNVSIRFLDMHFFNFFPAVFSVFLTIFLLLKSRKLIYD
jgi:lipopolysaccharide export system permease protein